MKINKNKLLIMLISFNLSCLGSSSSPTKPITITSFDLSKQDLHDVIQEINFYATKNNLKKPSKKDIAKIIIKSHRNLRLKSAFGISCNPKTEAIVVGWTYLSKQQK